MRSGMKEVDVAKATFYGLCATLVVGLAFAFGLNFGAVRTSVYRVLDRLQTDVRGSFATFAKEYSTLSGIHPQHFLQPARYAGNGVTINKVNDKEEQLVFVSSFFEDSNELRLIQRDGTVVNRWPVQFSKLFPDVSHIAGRDAPSTDWNIDINGAVALPDGAVVFSFEYGGLVKLDRCGSVVWTLRRMTHHTVERSSDGGFWVPAQRYYPARS